jgi:glucose-6-phosphate-specific signal transduction histidine kinase
MPIPFASACAWTTTASACLPTHPMRDWGLAGMRERAALVNGMLTIESGPGRGVHLTLEIPTEPDY